MGIERLAVRDIDLEVLRMGKGPPILLLHGLDTVDPQAPYLDRLAAHAEIIAPSHPGFGHSPRPADFDTVYDLVHLYLDLLETLPHEKVTLLGFSFGGWLAAEIAATCCHRLRTTDPGRSPRHQARRSREPRHPRSVQHRAGRGAAPHLA